MRTIGLLALGVAATFWLHRYEQRQAVAGVAPASIPPGGEVIDLAGWKAARARRRG